MVKTHQTFSDQPKLSSELIDYLYSGQGEKMPTTVRLAHLLCEDVNKRQKIADLVSSIENNRNGLYGSRYLRDKAEAKMVLACSTEAMEKNADIVIDRRFKRHGQSWTTEGVNNLLKLRTLWYNPVTGSSPDCPLPSQNDAVVDEQDGVALTNYKKPNQLT